ncbi:peptide deformylase [Candidatus Tisiphia endosymbiont of Beris chalybata]|uniref:peptide deformylase n=1 Tax=Candidatus Tisiphia endosymbiont of Beris chalybata TaxID=3066262 RepID=UPI00312C7C8A
MLKVRQIGDPQLHLVPAKADLSKIDLVQNYITILQEVKNLYGGVGIACNQCLEITNPIQLALVGVGDEKSKVEAQKRYPHEQIPSTTIMINPTIVGYSQETYYPTYGEGCLSVFGPIRGKVRRYSRITVQYQTLEGYIIKREVEGFEAHIIQHEYDHLLGIVYLQRIFQDCTLASKELIATLLDREINNRQNRLPYNGTVSNQPILVFDRKEDQVIFEPTLLSLLLTQLENSTLLGMKQCLQSPHPLH